MLEMTDSNYVSQVPLRMTRPPLAPMICPLLSQCCSWLAARPDMVRFGSEPRATHHSPERINDLQDYSVGKMSISRCLSLAREGGLSMAARVYLRLWVSACVCECVCICESVFTCLWDCVFECACISECMPVNVCVCARASGVNTVWMYVCFSFCNHYTMGTRFPHNDENL